MSQDIKEKVVKWDKMQRGKGFFGVIVLQCTCKVKHVIENTQC